MARQGGRFTYARTRVVHGGGGGGGGVFSVLSRAFSVPAPFFVVSTFSLVMICGFVDPGVNLTYLSSASPGLAIR